MLKSRKRKIDSFFRVLNIFLFSFILIGSIIFLLIMNEKEEDIKINNARSLLTQTKEDSMRSKEIDESLENNIKAINQSYAANEDLDIEKDKVDPDLEYAIKLFESDINKKISKTFKKPFNYKIGSYCQANILLDKERFNLFDCNGDSIYKRELQLALKEIFPIKRYTYNNINLRKKEFVILLKINE